MNQFKWFQIFVLQLLLILERRKQVLSVAKEVERVAHCLEKLVYFEKKFAASLQLGPGRFRVEMDQAKV